MKRVVEFIKTTAIGGLLVIVPIAIVLFVAAQLLFILYQLASTVLDFLGIAVNDAVVMFAIAALALIGLCFVTGLFVQTKLGETIRHWFGRNVAKRIPMYSAISNLAHSFAGTEDAKFVPVEVDLYGSDARVLALEIETLPDNRSVVYVPSAPVATVGNVFVVPDNRLQRIDASLVDTINVVSQFGVEAELLYREKKGPDDTA